MPRVIVYAPAGRALCDARPQGRIPTPFPLFAAPERIKQQPAPQAAKNLRENVISDGKGGNRFKLLRAGGGAWVTVGVVCCWVCGHGVVSKMYHLDAADDDDAQRNPFSALRISGTCRNQTRAVSDALAPVDGPCFSSPDGALEVLRWRR